jgi:hypothetical protein
MASNLIVKASDIQEHLTKPPLSVSADLQLVIGDTLDDEPGGMTRGVTGLSGRGSHDGARAQRLDSELAQGHAFSIEIIKNFTQPVH